MKSTILIAFVLLTVGCAYSVNIGHTIWNVINANGCPKDDAHTIEPGGVVTGLSSLETETTFNIITFILNFHVTLKYADATGINYSATDSINAGPISPEILPSEPFTGSGNYKAAISNFEFAGAAVFTANLVTDKVTVQSFQVDRLNFKELVVNLENLNIGGNEINWAYWSKNIKNKFDTDWAANKVVILEHIRLSSDDYLSKFTIQEFLEVVREKPCPTQAPQTA